MLSKSIARLQQRIDDFHWNRRHQQALFQAAEIIVGIVDPNIRLAHNYLKTLLPSVETAMTYCTDLVASIPGPVRLDQNRYHDDPLVKALFASADEMEMILRHARETELPRGGGEIVALLTMTRTEKTIFSHQQQGEVVLRDVSMRTVNFIEHRIVAPSADLQTTRTLLEQRSLEILATVAMQKIAALRAPLAELRERREHLAFMHRMLGGKQRAFELLASPDPANMEKIRELKQMLTTTEKEIESARKGLETPEDILDHLKQIIDAPADTLSLYKLSLCVNWMNVLVENDEQAQGNEITLAEFTVDSDLRRAALLVCFDTESRKTT